VTAPSPPYVPVRSNGWRVRRMPPLAYLAGAVILAIAVLVGLAHRPSNAQRVADLRGFVHDMNTDIESCAGGVSESLTALREISTGTETDVPIAVHIATYGAGNCSPANNQLLDDLTQYQVTESLASFRLNRVVNGLLTWATPDAQRVQLDVARVLTAHSASGKVRGRAALRADLRTLDAQRAAVDRIIAAADKSLSANVAPPRLPG
jgi:hypothetical protein